MPIDDNAAIGQYPASVGPAAREPVASASLALDSPGFQESESNSMPTDSYRVLSKRNLIALLRSCAVNRAALMTLILPSSPGQQLSASKSCGVVHVRASAFRKHPNLRTGCSPTG
jgi:hypothetical protein